MAQRSANPGVASANCMFLVFNCRLYICGCDSFDNVYVGSSFAQLDHRRAEVTGDRLLPLKKHEQRHLITATSWRLSRPEYHLYKSGLCVLTLCVATAVVVCSFDYALYWILSAVADPAATGTIRGRQRREATDGRPSARVQAPPSSVDARRVVAGDGVVVNLLDVFVRSFEPDWMQPAGMDEELRSLGCLPAATTPSLITIIILAVIYVLFFLSVVLKAYIHRARVSIAGYFYAERDAERTVHLYAVLLRRRRRLPCLLRQLALSGRRRRLAREGGCGSTGRRSWLVTVVLRRCVRPRCVVCGCGNDDKFRECPCGGLYCADCFVDVGRCCPLCRHDDAPACHLDDGYYDDDDEYDDDGSVDDALEAYSASSRVDI